MHRPERFEPKIGRSVSLEQAAQILGVSRRTIYNRIREGRLQTIRTLGGSQRVLLSSVVDADAERCLFEPRNVSTTPKVRHLTRTTLLALALVASAVPSFAARRARLSADLADHLAAGSQSIDVIVQGNPAAIEGLAARYAVTVKRRLKSGAVLRVNAGQLDALAGDAAFDHYSGDVPIKPSMAITNTAIGADQVWEGSGDVQGLTGDRVTVAVVDSGIDVGHHAVKGRVLATVDFTGGDGSDRYGHGTHVAAIIAGRAGRTPDARSVQGVAAGANLINLRVLGEDGSGVVSSVLEAIDWAIEHKEQYNIRVINLSLGTPVLQSYRDDPMCQAVERAVAAGLVVVASAGNYGKTADGKLVYGGITSPGNDPYALTVGALDTHATPQRSDDTVAVYSSRGPTGYDMGIKPDVVAPGSHIESAEASGSYLSTTYPERHVTGHGPNAYIQFSGSSMAAGVASGTVALLLQENPKLTPMDVKAVVQLTSSFLPAAGLLAGGAGSLNAAAAAEFVRNPAAKTFATTIANEDITESRIFFAPLNPAGSAIVWNSRTAIVWDSRTAIVWDSRTAIVWDSRTAIVWDSRTAIVWDSATAIVWDSATAIVWDSATAIVWDSATAIVWDSATAIVWDSATAIVWDSATAIVWDSALDSD